MNLSNMIHFIYHIPLFSIFCKFFLCARIFTPHIRWLKQKGIPGGLSVSLVIILFAFIVTVLVVGVVGVIIRFENQIPIYQIRLTEFRDIPHVILPYKESCLLIRFYVVLNQL